MSLSRSTGKFILVENGKVAAEKYSNDIVQYMEKIPIKVSKHAQVQHSLYFFIILSKG